MASSTQFIKIEPETEPPLTNVDNSSNWQYLVVTEETEGSDQDVYSNNKESGYSSKRRVFSYPSLGIVEQEQSLDGSLIREGHTVDEEEEKPLRVRDEDDENDDEFYDSGWQIAGSQSSGEEENGSASRSTERNDEDMKCMVSDTMNVPTGKSCSRTTSQLKSKCGQRSFTTKKIPSGLLVQYEKHVPPKRQIGDGNVLKYHKCEVCGKVIPSKRVKQHMLFHSGERNYTCSHCGRRFFTKSHCRDHERIHERRAVSDSMKSIESKTMKVKGSTTDCREQKNKTSDKISQLDTGSSLRDMNNDESVAMKVLDGNGSVAATSSHNHVEGYERFPKSHQKCEVCGKFIVRKNMKKHMVFHSGERNYPCPHCGKRFFTRSHCRDHERIHERRAVSESMKSIDSEPIKIKGLHNDSKGEQDKEKFPSIFTSGSHQNMNYKHSETVKVLEDGAIGTALQHTSVANDLPSKHTFVQEKLERREACGKKDTSNPKRLLMFHTGERMFIYSCRFCGLVFLTKRHCWIHEQTHVVTDPTCSLCGQECMNISGLGNHVCKVCDRKEVHVDTKAIERKTTKVKPVCDEDNGSITSSVCTDNKRAKDNSLLKNENAPIQGCAPKNHKRCEVCGKYVPQSYIKKHMLFHSGERNYPCSHCGKRFFTKSHCRDHEKIHNRGAVGDDMKSIDSDKRPTTDSKGKQENKTLEKISSLGAGSSPGDMNRIDNKNMKDLDENGFARAAPSDTCMTTKCATDSSLSNIEHLPLKNTPVECEEIVPRNYKKCEVCGKFIPPGRMKKHMLFHSGERNYPCSHCGKRFFTRSHCRDHEKTHDVFGADELTCSECGRECVSYSGFKRHMRVHGKQRGYRADSAAKHKQNRDTKLVIACEKCGKLVKGRRGLVSHMLCHSYHDGIKCDICNKVFKNPRYLEIHKKIHTDQTPENLCHVCGKLFRTFGHLESHMIIHSDIRGLICNICNKTFKHNLSLKFHKRIHSGHRPYVCSICKMAFFTVTCLKKHERVHRGKSLFKCPQCDISFSSKYSLNLHVETHSDPEPHDCHLCKSTFVAKRLLDRHLERFHEEERSQTKLKQIIE